MRAIHLLLAGSMLIATGAVQARTKLPPDAQLARILQNRVAGEPVNCINQRSITSSQVVADTAIVYRSGGILYVNRPRGGADALDDDTILVTRTIGTNLCSIDVVNLIDRNTRFQRGFVSLGEFVPYRKVD